MEGASFCRGQGGQHGAEIKNRATGEEDSQRGKRSQPLHPRMHGKEFGRGAQVQWTAQRHSSTGHDNKQGLLMGRCRIAAHVSGYTPVRLDYAAARYFSLCTHGRGVRWVQLLAQHQPEQD